MSVIGSTSGESVRPTIPGTRKYTQPLGNETKFKIKEPGTFSGNRNQVNEWITQLRNFFAFKDIDDDMKSAYAASLMVGPAFKWIEPYLGDYLRGPRDMGKDGDGNSLTDRDFDRKFQFMFTFDKFERKVRETFGMRN